MKPTIYSCILVMFTAGAVMADSVEDAISQLQKIRLFGQDNVQASEAVAVLSRAPASEIPRILAGMQKGRDVANNYLRAAAEAVADRHPSEIPIEELLKMVKDRSFASRGREVAFEWVVAARGDAVREQLLSSMLDDPSLELRRLAVAQRLSQLEQAEKPDVAGLRTLLRQARDIDQVQALKDKLIDQGERVDLPRLFGFITNWHLVAPFDNTDTKGFDTPYPPEEGVDLSASYIGKNGKRIRWVVHTTEDEFGMVNLKSVFGKNKGAAAYAFCEFDAIEAQDVDLRLGCINANKVWLNGQLIFANHVYHAGTAIDQYVGKGRLRKGPNQILLKICENEQTEPWAQDWQFQFRVCDELGTAVLSKDRLSAQAQ